MIIYLIRYTTIIWYDLLAVQKAITITISLNNYFFRGEKFYSLWLLTPPLSDFRCSLDIWHDLNDLFDIWKKISMPFLNQNISIINFSIYLLGFFFKAQSYSMKFFISYLEVMYFREGGDIGLFIKLVP